MKTHRAILSLVLCAMSLIGFSQDFARMSEQSISGTARYVGMGGAMSAIGGDPSAVMDNVAGLGLYRRAELLVTFEELIDKTWQVGMDEYDLHHSFMCPQASAVFSVPMNNTTGKGVLFNNFMISYHRKHNYDRTLYGRGGSDASLGALLPTLDIPFCADAKNRSNELDLWEIGSSNIFSIDWAMNISNQWYVGAGIRMLYSSMTSEGKYEENFFSKNAQGEVMYNQNISSLRFSSFTCGFSAGLIYRPTGWLRLGLGIQTPSLGNLSMFTSGRLVAMTDSLRTSYAPDASSRDSKFHMPLHVSSSVAFQISAYGLIGLQYDYSYQPHGDSFHSLRAGVEVIPVMGMYINAGYAFESKFNGANTPVPMDSSFDRQDTYFVHPKWSHNVSVAIGYRGEYMLFQAAYQYRLQRINLYAHEAANPYDMHADTHRIVFTLGWHRN